MKRMPMLVLASALLFACGCSRIGIDRRDDHGMTALMHAARDGNVSEAERLLDRGANVNAKVPTRDAREFIAFISWMQQLPESRIGATPLIFAAEAGSYDIARLLLDRRARVEEADRLGWSALDVAVSKDNLRLAHLLVERGARPAAKNLAWSVGMGTPEMAQFLIEHGVSIHDSSHALLLIMATRRGAPEIMRLLIERGADVNARDANGWTALRWARYVDSRRQSYERSFQPAIQLLESAGASDESGMRDAALFDAIFAKDAGKARSLLKEGADPNGKDDRGVTPLIYAGNLGQAEIVGALVDAGADVNISPEHDTTPLLAAVSGGSLEAVQKLLQAGAKVNQPDHLKRTALQEASSRGQNAIAALLLESSAQPDPQSLAIAALRGNAEQVRTLLSRGVDPNAGSGHILSEATRACYRRDNTEIVRLLLESGANPKIADDTGYTALHRAAGLCPVEAVRLLLDRGADPNARDLNKVTPLISAASSGNVENVRALIAAHADVNVRDADGKSVLEYAVRYPEVQEELRRAGAR